MEYSSTASKDTMGTKTVRKLPERYKGKRRSLASKTGPDFVQIICSGCDWKSRAGKAVNAEMEYLLHLDKVHYGILECAFCGAELSRGIRCHGSFGALAHHVKVFHPFLAPAEEGHLPKGAFK